MKWLTIFFGVVLVSAGAEQEAASLDPTELLLKVRKRVVATVDRLPNYLCTESIERSNFRPEVQVTNPFERNEPLKGVSCGYLAKLRSDTTWRLHQTDSDRLRVDVVFSKDSEMYSPTGENRFPDRNLADMVETGVTSSGAFGTFLSGIFAGNSAHFTYTGETRFQGRTLAEFRFRVPLDKGSYSVKNIIRNKTSNGTAGSQIYSAMVPYGGTFLVDPKTFDLVRLTVNAEQLPEQLKVCEITSTVDYSIAHLSHSEFLLPTNTRLRVVNDDGSESENNTSFSGCREFVGQSTLRFGGVADSQPAVAEHTARVPALPTQPDREQMLLNVRNKIMATIERLPRYVCTETVDRSVFVSRPKNGDRACEALTASAKKLNEGRRPNQSDRLRLDVAVSKDGEMYSWVGENRFGDRNLIDLVGGGVISTGAFGTFLRGIFAGSSASFSGGRAVAVGGRALLEFGFQVTREKSAYSVEDKAFATTVPYQGTFTVDPQTFDLVRLVVHANQLPERLGTCGITTTLDYHKVELNNFAFLLPSAARLQVISGDGGESDNFTLFSACHEFHTESKLSFDEPAAALVSRSEAGVSKTLTLPAGLRFVVSLAEPINAATAAAGDTFIVRLTNDIKRSDAILIPKGAIIKGRIVRFTRIHGSTSQSLALAIRPETIERNDAAEPFEARFATMVEGLPDTPTHPGGMSLDLGSFDQMFERDDPRISLLRFENATENYVIHRGLKFQGVTISNH